MPPLTAVFIQDACYQHQYIRSKDTSAIYERPERLRAVKVGVAAAIAHLEESSITVAHPDERTASSSAKSEGTDELADAFSRINITQDSPNNGNSPVVIVHSSASVNLLNNPAVKFVHGDIDGDVYTQNLKLWASESWDKIASGECEIPDGLPKNDLYLCPESINAIQGALGTVCEAVDRVIADSSSAAGDTTSPNPINRAFVAIRPPGHHCGEDTPSGFCFVNNVAVAAAHAVISHNIKRVVILDIDLHHGNGTQSIVWQINEESYRQTLESEGEHVSDAPRPQIYYGSIHDILSFPCEDGKPELVQAASTSIHGAHGQYIENIHLQTYTSNDHFWDTLYANQYSKLIRHAEKFLDQTGGPGKDVLIFISCGMDACEHEYPSMSRHNRKVPASFYYRFTQDVCKLSDLYAEGRLISVLEGGYSDRALISGTMAHLSGLAERNHSKVDEERWNVENLIKVEAATKKRRGGRQSLSTGPVEPWLERAATIFSSLETNSKISSSASHPRIPVAPSTRTLRERKKPSPTPSPQSIRLQKSIGNKRKTKAPPGAHDEQHIASDESSLTDISGSEKSDPDLGSLSLVEASDKKLPRVILKLGPRPSIE